MPSSIIRRHSLALYGRRGPGRDLVVVRPYTTDAAQRRLFCRILLLLLVLTMNVLLLMDARVGLHVLAQFSIENGRLNAT